MSRPMIIDFALAAPDERAARSVAALVEDHGFDPSICEDDRSGAWSVYCSKSMLATYDGVVAVQTELNRLVAALGCHCDGWASFGNDGI